jgi:hypothetical protein
MASLHQCHDQGTPKPADLLTTPTMPSRWRMNLMLSVYSGKVGAAAASVVSKKNCTVVFVNFRLIALSRLM